MVCFLTGAPASEVYRAAIEHEVGPELTSAARECRGQTSVQSALSYLTCECAPKRKLAIKCCMGFYGRQSLTNTRTHISHARTHISHARTHISHARTHILHASHASHALHARTHTSFPLSLIASFCCLAIQSTLISISPSGVVVSIKDWWPEGCGFKSCYLPFFEWE
jgi:hypothetical protein